MQALLRKGFVDPWGRDKDGRLHFRVSVDLWEEERDEFPECTVAIENVEEYVQKMELDMRQKRESTKGLTWFEEYVSQATGQQQSGTAVCYSAIIPQDNTICGAVCSHLFYQQLASTL